MPEFPRTRDCLILRKGDSTPVYVTASTAQTGWSGGQGAMWAPPESNLATVQISSGSDGGFFLWGSNESSDQYTSMTGQFPSYRFAVLGYGGWMISTATYERYTYASRTGGGPLVSLVYSEGARLRFSLRGYWTKEDEWTLSGDPRAPNDIILGYVCQAPTVETSYFMTIQTSL